MTPRLAGGLLICGFVSMELFLRRGTTARRVRPTATDRGTSILIVASYVLALVAMASRVLPSVALSEVGAWVGVAVGILGFALRIWAMRVLGRFYTRTLIIAPDQPVVRQGPYRLVRHPGYLGSTLIWVGAAASSGNLLCLAAVSSLLAVAYAYRIVMEEQMLIDALGKPYIEYRRHSWRIVPFVF